LWELIGRLGQPVLFAPASAALLYLLHQTTQLVLPDAILHSLLALAAGYSLAAVVALPLGFALGRVAWVSELLHPLLTGIYAIPPAAFKYAHRPQTQNLSFFQ
jgi:ABC-type nitrate/sulfonate/bicarbonate transport system permease component